MACYSGITIGSSWFYTDCYGVYQSGSGPGFQICYDSEALNEGISPSTDICIPPSPTPTPTVTPTPPLSYNYYEADPCCPPGPTIVVRIPASIPVNLGSSGFDFSGKCYFITGPSASPTYDFSTSTVLDDYCLTDECTCPTPTPTATPTATPTPTVTPTVTPTPSVTPTNTPTNTITPTPSVTTTPSNTPTPSVTATPSNTPTSSVTPTPSVTATPSNTPTSSVTPTPSITPTTSNTPTPSLSPGVSPTPSPTNTPTSSVTPTPSVTATPSNTPTSSVTPTPSITPTTSNTPTPSLSPGVSPTPSPTNTPTSSVTPTPSVTATPSNTPTSSVTPTPSITPTTSNTPTPSLSPGESPTTSPTNTPTSSVTPTPSVTATPSNTPTSSVTPTPSITPTTSNTPTPSPTPSPTPLNCPSNFCVEINIDAYSGYNGTYSFYTIHNGKYAWTGGTLPGFIYYKNTTPTSWCLSNALDGTCISTGPLSPFCDGECPDFDPTVVYSGTCLPGPSNPCSGLTFSADFYCNVVTVESPTPTPTNTTTPTPTPTTTDSTCASFGAVVSVTDATPTPTMTPSPTPTPTFARSVNTGGTVNFIIDSGDFVCYDVKELSDCETGVLYYIAGNLQYNGITVDVGTTIKAYLNNDLKCLTYQRDVNGSATAYMGVVQSTGTTCSSCGITPTPTPTSSVTPTPTMTPTPTPVPTVAPTTNFVFQSCTQNKLVIQSAQPGTLVSGRVVKINNECFTYLGSYTNYIPPVGYQTVYNNFITSTPTTQYDTCTSCTTPPTYYYQVIKQTENCQNTGSSIYVTKPSNVSTPTVGQYVSLSGSGYAPYCWKVIGVSTTAATATGIIAVHNQCDCSD